MNTLVTEPEANDLDQPVTLEWCESQDWLRGWVYSAEATVFNGGDLSVVVSDESAPEVHLSDGMWTREVKSRRALLNFRDVLEAMS